MNQMYLNDIDLMKFEHSIRSDLDMFMIECYEDYYCEAEGAKEGIFQKIKRKIKEIFEKLKAIFRGNKVKQMDANIKEAEKAVQNMSSEQKSKKVEVFDGEKALKLIEEDHEKAKKDPNHKRLDKKKIIALCTIPVTIGVAITILLKNKKVLPKILDKEQELNKEMEKVEEEDKKEREERKKFMSDYKNEVRTAGYSVNKGIYGKGKYAMPPKIKKNFSRTTSIRTDYYPDSLDDIREIGGSATFNLHRNDTRFITYQREIISTNVNQYVGIYTLIIDKNTNQAKEIAEYRDPTMPKETAYIKDVKFKTSHDDFNGIDTTTIDYDSKLLGHHETLTHKQDLY